ncbi:MAG: DNA polymerase III subunit delta' [Alphaproteobacteria bacterium]|nr:DNA polymerase III subunit delta' [Alphaproteobacteria bacterium]
MSDSKIPEPDCLEGATHPRHTAQIFGQDRAEHAFLDAYNTSRLHHGWLITGAQGIGKATLAWRIARFLLAETSETSNEKRALAKSLETPPETALFRRISALSEPRLYLCRRPWDQKGERLKKDITVDEVRKLKGFFNLSAADGGRRVAIVDSADEMNISAANALLKILEEPPEKTTILLISHRPMSLLPTIRSRCRELRCAPVGPDDLGRALSLAGFDEGRIDAGLTTLAAGSIGEAIRLLASDGVPLYGELVALLKSAPGMARPALLRMAESCGGKNATGRYDLVLGLLERLLHRLALAGIGADRLSNAVSGEIETLSRLSPDPARARIWAELSQTLAARSAHGRAVNLDPTSVILDMLLKIDQTAARQATA